MDGFSNASLEKQTIYEIYRACRMCGAGAGYKMPIIQSVVHLDGAEVELKQKIRECVQIEVYQGDKMPPLICELCVDKVNDFYEFLEMCRQTNKRTRLRLGLPPQTLSTGAPDSGDCILGITEPVYLNNDSNIHNAKSKGKNIKRSKHKPPEDKSKIVNVPPKKEKEGGERRLDVKITRSKHSSPPRLRGGTKRSNEDDISLGSLLRSKRSTSTVSVQSPKSILKKTENEEPSPRLTRQKEVTIKKEALEKKETPLKKIKIVINSPPLPAKPSPKSKSLQHRCNICRTTFSTTQAMISHMKIHNKPDKEVKEKELKAVHCSTCGKSFVSRVLQSLHRCSTRSPHIATPTPPITSQSKKVTDKCESCGESVALKAMREHRTRCASASALRKPKTVKELIVDPLVRRKLRPLQIRMSKCDPLLQNQLHGHYDVSDVDFGYGIDEECAYPYLWSRHIKSEPDYMVKINDDIKHALDEQDYVHWDSDDTASDIEDTSDIKKVDSLSTLSLKTIFSPKLLGKVPKKQRKLKAEKAFDSILNSSDVDFDMRIGIDSIINRLDQSIDMAKDKDSDSLFGDDKPATPGVTNEDFDSIFGNNDKTNDVSNDNETIVSRNKDISTVSEENNYNATRDVQSKQSANDDVKSLQIIHNISEEKENNCIDNINEREGEKEKGARVNGDEELDIDMNDLEDVSASEMDDSKLMDELDAQIGEQV